MNAAAWDGVYVNAAGNPSAATFSSANNGFEVAGAGGYGLYIGRADIHGVRVASVGGTGMRVDSAHYGVAQVKVQDGASIQPGQRLTAAADGTARALQTRTLDGMVVTEGAPVIGVALDA